MPWIIEATSGNNYFTNTGDILNFLTFFNDNIDGIKSLRQLNFSVLNQEEPDTSIYYIVGKDTNNVNQQGFAFANDAGKLIDTVFVDWEISVALKTNYILVVQ